MDFVKHLWNGNASLVFTYWVIAVIGNALFGISDRIRIGSTRIRLHGIDAPEAKQTCTANGKEWRCGWEATNALANIVGRHWVTCSKRDVDRYGRVVAVCRAGPIDLNAWMVSEGWAVAYRRFSMDYVRDEQDAKAGRKGMWRGEFMIPWEWRRSNK